MKKIFMISFAAAILAGGALAAKSAMDSKQVDLFKANVEALTIGEGVTGVGRPCYSQLRPMCVWEWYDSNGVLQQEKENGTFDY